MEKPENDTNCHNSKSGIKPARIKLNKILIKLF